MPRSDDRERQAQANPAFQALEELRAIRASVEQIEAAKTPEYEEAMITLGDTVLTGVAAGFYFSAQIGPPFIVKEVQFLATLQENPTPHTDPRLGLRIFVVPDETEDTSGENIWGRYSESGGHDVVWVGLPASWSSKVGFQNRRPNQFIKARFHNNAHLTVVRFTVAVVIQLRPDWGA